MNNCDISNIEKIIGYTYKDSRLLVQAFTHSSYANENNVEDYERLEFLGDSILETLTTIFLYNHYSKTEGDLSKIRAKVVSAPSLYKVISELGLVKYIRVGGSIGKNIPLNIVADIFEAIVASIYLDGGLGFAEEFVNNKLLKSEDNIASIVDELVDYKTVLQEKLQARNLHAIYEATELKKGNSLEFEVSLIVNGKVIAKSTAVSKKLAEQTCAREILERNGGEHFEF